MRIKPFLIAASLASFGLGNMALGQQIYGTLGNFDAVNNTGKTAHGFEIDLEGISVSDVHDTFGGGGRGFPPTVERYGAPTISPTATGVSIVYGGPFLFSGSSWNVGTPSGTILQRILGISPVPPAIRKTSLELRDPLVPRL